MCVSMLSIIRMKKENVVSMIYKAYQYNITNTLSVLQRQHVISAPRTVLMCSVYKNKLWCSQPTVFCKIL